MVWKVTYVSPDEHYISSDKFLELRQARRFALGLRKEGYKKISIIPCDF